MRVYHASANITGGIFGRAQLHRCMASRRRALAALLGPRRRVWSEDDGPRETLTAGGSSRRPAGSVDRSEMTTRGVIYGHGHGVDTTGQRRGTRTAVEECYDTRHPHITAMASATVERVGWARVELGSRVKKMDFTNRSRRI